MTDKQNEIPFQVPFSLSMPPSVNSMYVNNFRNGRGRYKSSEYSKWTKSAGLQLFIQLRKSGAKIELLNKKLKWGLEATFSWRLGAGGIWCNDFDNREKALIDLICQVLNIEDRYLLYKNTCKEIGDKRVRGNVFIDQ